VGRARNGGRRNWTLRYDFPSINRALLKSGSITHSEGHIVSDTTIERAKVRWNSDCFAGRETTFSPYLRVFSFKPETRHFLSSLQPPVSEFDNSQGTFVAWTGYILRLLVASINLDPVFCRNAGRNVFRRMSVSLNSHIRIRFQTVGHWISYISEVFINLHSSFTSTNPVSPSAHFEHHYTRHRKWGS
jgi:hypothetical protein